MSFSETVHTFPHGWATLTAANWRKYPNLKTPHVISVDVLNRWVDPQTGVLYTERLLQCEQKAPAILKWIGINVGDTAFFRETSALDPRSQHYEATSVNLTMRQYLTVEEVCTFVPDAAQPEAATEFRQKVRFTAVGVMDKIARAIESAAVSAFVRNAHKGREALDAVTHTIRREASELEARLELTLRQEAATLRREASEIEQHWGGVSRFFHRGTAAASTAASDTTTTTPGWTARSDNALSPTEPGEAWQEGGGGLTPLDTHPPTTWHDHAHAHPTDTTASTFGGSSESLSVSLMDNADDAWTCPGERGFRLSLLNMQRAGMLGFTAWL